MSGDGTGETGDGQLELFEQGPFTVRMSIPEALRYLWDFYWHRLPSAKASRQTFLRLSKFFGNLYLDTASKLDVQEMRREFRFQGLSEASINKAHCVGSRLYTLVAEWKEIGWAHGVDWNKVQVAKVNPFSQVKRFNEASLARQQVCTPTQFQKLMRYADREMREDIQMLIWTRLHPGDFMELTQVSFNWETYQITGVQSKSIHHIKKPAGKMFVIPMTYEMEMIVRRRIVLRPIGANLFPMTNWQKKWTALRRATDLMALQRRDFRRTGASHLLDSGIDELTVSEGLTHTTTRMLKVYAPRTRKHLRESTRKLVNTFIADET